MQLQNHRVAHRGKLLHLHYRAGNEAHIEEMLAELSAAANGGDEHFLPCADVVECCFHIASIRFSLSRLSFASPSGFRVG